MVRENPEAANDVIGNLSVVKACFLQELLKNLVAEFVAKFNGEVVGFDQGKQSKGKGVQRQEELLLHTLWSQAVLEFLGQLDDKVTCRLMPLLSLLRTSRKWSILKLIYLLNKKHKNMACDISLGLLVTLLD